MDIKNEKVSHERAFLKINGDEYELPIIAGSEGEEAIDIRTLRETTGLLAYDAGFANTATCLSNIIFVDGEQGILRYRGYSIKDLIDERVDFVAVAYLIIFEELPTNEERSSFRDLLIRNEFLHEDMLKSSMTLYRRMAILWPFFLRLYSAIVCSIQSCARLTHKSMMSSCQLWQDS